MTDMKHPISILKPLLLVGLLVTASSCHEFIFGNINVDDTENPLIQKKTPRSGAEIYYGTEEGQHTLPIDKAATVKNPDAQGALANWYTCLVMMKEGHSHYFGKMHANPVYTRKAWKQEQFAEVRNTPSGEPQVLIDKHSIRNYLEEQRGYEGPNYFRLIGGAGKMWACCLYFYDKEGRLLNDSILKHSDQYQIFYTVSDKDQLNQPYKVMDVRYQAGMPSEGIIEGVEAQSFKGKDSFAARQEMTPLLFTYTYRDTWTHDDMADGARNFFNIKLLPPLGPKDIFDVTTADQDCVGLKGHLVFDFDDYANALDRRDQWPLQLSEHRYNGRTYRRPSFLLPQFYLAVRVMKCEKQKKAVVPATPGAQSTHMCAPSYAPDERSQWTELIRFNLPIKVFSSTFDSDPTNSDAYEPYYYHIGREIGLSPEDTFEFLRSSGGESGVGYDAWFL